MGSHRHERRRRRTQNPFAHRLFSRLTSLVCMLGSGIFAPLEHHGASKQIAEGPIRLFIRSIERNISLLARHLGGFPWCRDSAHGLFSLLVEAVTGMFWFLQWLRISTSISPVRLRWSRSAASSAAAFSSGVTRSVTVVVLVFGRPLGMT